MKNVKNRYNVLLVLIVLITLSLGGNTLLAKSKDDESDHSKNNLIIEIEAENGISREVDIVDSPPSGYFLGIFTERYGTETGNDNKYNVAVQVNEHNEITKIANKDKSWTDSPNLPILENGYTLLAQDDSYDLGYRAFLVENFNVGETVKLLVNGEEVSIQQFKDLTEDIAKPSRLDLDQPNMFSVSKEEKTTEISGSLTNYSPNNQYSIQIFGEEITLSEDGSFTTNVQLEEKTNYIDVEVYREGRLESVEHVIIYRYMREHHEHDVWLWIEQSTNAKNYPDKESIRQMLLKAKDAGVTGVQFPAKGHEGFVSYLKNDLSGTPHISQIQEKSKQGVPEDFDMLQAFIEVARDLDLKIVAVFNVYGGGTATYSDSKPYELLSSALTEEQLYQYEEWLYSVDDGGEIKRFSESNYKDKVIHFLNPANDDVQEYQMAHFEEVMRNYDVDAIVLDRARYDTMHADFSPESKAKFESFLQDRGKTLERWPEDIFEHKYDESGNFIETVNGPLYYDWLAFRSHISKDFMIKVREMVDQVNMEQGTQIQYAISLGSWYESYYQSGQNWASPDFEYDERLNFPVEELYKNPEYRYNETAFGDPDIFDYMVIGTYQNSAEQIKRYLTLLNILTMESFPVYAGMQIPVLPDPAEQREAFQAAFEFSNGIKMFDLSRLNWEIQKAAINDYEYVKQYQLGISIPENMQDFPDHFEDIAQYEALIEKGFIEGDYLNQGLAKQTIMVYNNAHGERTGTTGRFNVEVIVDGDGKVNNVINKEEALNWSWSNSSVSNSVIPEGGMVISTLDNDGIKTYRQLIAHVFSSGDEVRAALLRGHLDYDGLETTQSEINFEGNVELIGTGEEIEVKVDGIKYVPDAFGDFSALVDLDKGINHIIIEVFVDGLKTNEVSVEIEKTKTYDVETVKEAVAEAEINPSGIRNSLLARLNNAQKEFEKASKFLEKGNEKQAEKFMKKGYKTLSKLAEWIQKHSGKHIDELDALRLIEMLNHIVTNQTIDQ